MDEPLETKQKDSERNPLMSNFTPIQPEAVTVEVEGAKLYEDGAVEFDLTINGEQISLTYFNGEFEHFSTPEKQGVQAFSA